jgi:hypothetical protein
MKHLIRILQIVLFFSLFPGLLPAHEDSSIVKIYPKLNDGTLWRKISDVNSTPLMIATSGIAILDFTGILKLKETWYNDKRGRFHTVPWESDIQCVFLIHKV